MKLTKHLISITAVGLLGQTIIASAEDRFIPACTLPYATISKHRPIDEICPPEGIPASPQHAAEYRAKNEVCAPGSIVDVTLNDLSNMQKTAEDAGIPVGQRDTPVPDRTKLKGIHTLPGGNKVGEGDVVRAVVYIISATPTGAKHSDGTAGEGVNCKQPGAPLNDIHIDIASSPTAKSCSGIVVEMIPHFRPTKWTPTNLRKLAAKPVRISGHLFFDSRHNVSTCSKPSKGDPPRVSLWEIHPVYAVDVCKFTTLSKCDVGEDTVWIPFDQWLSSPAAKGAKHLPQKGQREQMRHE